MQSVTAYALDIQERSDPQFGGEEDGARDADELADEEADHDAGGDGRGRRVAADATGQFDAGVGEGEERDDEVTRPRVQ